MSMVEVGKLLRVYNKASRDPGPLLGTLPVDQILHALFPTLVVQEALHSVDRPPSRMPGGGGVGSTKRLSRAGLILET